MITHCHICRTVSNYFGSARVLNHHEVTYYCCPACGLIQTEFPHWLDEAYSKAITSSDIGLISRNLSLANSVPTIINVLFDANQRFLDYGAGYGVFVRLMRDRGFDFYWYDNHCENLFAQSFEGDLENGDFQILTAIEVFEHLANPLAEVQRMRSLAPNIMFTTTLVPDPPLPLNEWWYYGLEHGQHISLYTHTALQILAAKVGLNYCSNGHIHLFTEHPINSQLFEFISHPLILRIVSRFFRRPSLLGNDYQRLTNTQLR